MSKLTGGPANGVNLGLRRSPYFLRVVRGKSPEWDALDQLSDTPATGELIWVYRKISDDGTAHYSGRDKNGKRFGRWESMATYTIHENQPDDATVRDPQKWPEWCQQEYARLTTGMGENVEAQSS